MWIGLTYLGLQTKTAADGIFSLYDGNHFTFTTSSCSWLTTLKLFWRYGLSLVKMQQATKDLLNKFGNIYTLQENGNVFESVPELLQAMSGNDDFYRLTKISAREYLLEQGISELLINELITAIIKNNYGQSPDVNALTGMPTFLKICCILLNLFYCQNACIHGSNNWSAFFLFTASNC